jgi:hypothetical protein
MSKTEVLTAAFNKGVETGKSGHDGVPASLRFKGSAENFYWAGYKKGKAEYTAYVNSPEYAKMCRERNIRMRKIAWAVDAMSHGQHDLARQILNEEIGLNIS